MRELYETPEEMEAAAKAAGLTMRKVCAKSPHAYSTWYRWRNGQTKPTLEVIVSFATALAELRVNGG